MNERELIDRLRSAEWPAPSSKLRARIAATPVTPETIGWADRVWFSRSWRIGMAASALAIVALDVWGTGSNRPVPPPQDEAGTQVVAELIQSVGLPEDLAVSLARRSSRTSTASALDLATLDAGILR